MTSVRDDTASELLPLLRVLRKRGDEVQLTQIIHAVAAQERAFAAGFARVIVAHSRRDDAPVVPPALACRAEQFLSDVQGSSTGRGDLLFEDEQGTFSLLVELKLGSGYGVRQLERYLRSLDTLAGGESARLIAVTTHLPSQGETRAVENPRWLGSVRWADVYEQLRGLSDDLTAAGKPLLAETWSTILAVAREQGDFGPMDFDPELLTMWAQRENAERVLSGVLRQLIPSTCERLRVAVGADPDDKAAADVRLKGRSQQVHVVKKRVLVRFDVWGQERFWIQFYARRDGTAIFTAEARHQDAKRPLSPAVIASTEAASDLQHGKDEFGHSWKLGAVPAADLPCGADVRDELQRYIESTIDRCAHAGIFDVLATEHASGPSATELLDEAD